VPSNLSNREERKLKNIAKQYRFENNKLFILKRKKLLEIPRINDRDDIILKAHNFGHFRTEYKKNCDKCSTCQRNGKSVKYYHPALATDVSNAFKRVCVDLVLGLSESDEGYVGIMVIVEFLTKYPFAKPIRSKNASEIAT
ncbi:hypothetical protein BpHYR1_022203, partial [Brachionus plicatilis]